MLRRSLYVFVLVVLATGCAPTLYAPEPYHLPLHDDAGELQIGGTHHVASVSLKASATPLPHLILYGAGSVSKGARDSLKQLEAGRRMWEVGAGTYVDLPGALVTEVLVGGGRGSVADDGAVLPYSPYRVQGQTSRQFLQIDVGASDLTTEPPLFPVDAGIGLRASRVTLSQLHSSDRGRLPSKTRGFFLAPIAVGRVRYGGFSLDFSVAHSYAVDPFEDPYSHVQWRLGLGLSLHPHHFFDGRD